MFSKFFFNPGFFAATYFPEGTGVVPPAGGVFAFIPFIRRRRR